MISCDAIWRSDDVELHVISLTYKDLAGLSNGDKRGESIDKATFLQNFPVPGLVGGTFCVFVAKETEPSCFIEMFLFFASCCFLLFSH